MRLNLLIILMLPLYLFAQRRDKEERIIYFTDDQVKRSSVFLAADGSGIYSNRSVLGQRGAGFAPGAVEQIPRSRATFAYHYGGYFGIRLSRSLEVSFGVSQNNAGWLNRRTEYEGIATQTRVRLNQTNLPVHFSFFSKMNDFLILEVVPMLELNMLTSYTEDISMRREPFSDLVKLDLVDEARQFNISVGIAIGGRFMLTDQFSFYARPFFRYMVNPILETDDRPREVVWGVGLMTGLRFDFL